VPVLVLERPRAAGDHAPTRRLTQCVAMADANRRSRRRASGEGDGGEEAAGAGGAGGEAGAAGAGEAGAASAGEAGAAGAGEAGYASSHAGEGASPRGGVREAAPGPSRRGPTSALGAVFAWSSGNGAEGRRARRSPTWLAARLLTGVVTRARPCAPACAAAGGPGRACGRPPVKPVEVAAVSDSSRHGRRGGS
jgi:hypothetical protein